VVSVLLYLSALIFRNSPFLFALLTVPLLIWEFIQIWRSEKAPTQTTIIPENNILLIFLFVFWIWLCLHSETIFSGEDLSYHAPFHAWWITSGQFNVPEFGYQNYFPANTELFSFWLFFNEKSEHMAALAKCIWVFLLFHSWKLSLENMKKNSLLGLSILFLLVTPLPFQRFAEVYTSVDLCVAATSLFALSMCWLPEQKNHSWYTKQAALCGLALGIGFGAKAIVFPLVLCCFFWWGKQSLQQKNTHYIAAFLIGFLLTGTYWYCRNLWFTGNPIFPAEFWFFDGPFDSSSRQKTTVLHVLSNPELYNIKLRHYVEMWIFWTTPYVYTAALGFLMALFHQIFRPRSAVHTYYWFVLISILSFCVFFLWSPFSATSNLPYLRLHFPFRYICFPLLLSSLLNCPPNSASSKIWSGLSLIPIAIAVYYCTEFHDPLLLLQLCILSTLMWRVSKSLSFRLRDGAMLVFIIIAIGFFSYNQSHERKQIPYGWVRIGKAKQERLELFEIINALPPSTIGILALEPNNLSYLYPVFGRHYQHRPFLINQDGTKRTFLHEETHTWWEHHIDQTLDPATSRQNLATLNLDYIIMSRVLNPHDPWLIEIQASSPNFVLEYEDEYHQLWKIRVHE